MADSNFAMKKLNQYSIIITKQSKSEPNLYNPKIHRALLWSIKTSMTKMSDNNYIEIKFRPII